MDYKRIAIAVIGATVPFLGFSQSAIDAMALSQTELRGTARFMSMAGAFGALGGDLSTLNYNPGGIGVFRSSTIGASLDISMYSSKSVSQGFESKNSMTKADCNNFGYVGAISTGSDIMPYFNFGASYSRVASFNRRISGQFRNMNGSLTNYVAGYTSADGWPSNDLSDYSSTWNPYQNTTAPWMSVLFYNSYLINPTGALNSQNEEVDYDGLWQDGTTGRSAFDVEERGHVDEYALDFGGNLTDAVYWGVGFGITDITYGQYAYYEEDLQNARISNAAATATETGNGGFGLDGTRRIDGSGFNFKAGVIVKPIQELRLGLAVHTPTYYRLSQYEMGVVDYGFSTGFNGIRQANDGYMSRVDWKLQTPWRLMASVAGVIGQQAIISVDYEYRPYQDMTLKSDDGREFSDLNGDVDTYYKSANILRVGAEYRLSPNWSIRAGFSTESEPITKEMKNAQVPVYTSGIDDYGMIPSYTMDNSTRYITCGIGYRYENFYADAAYVNKHKTSTFSPYTPNGYTDTPPSAAITENVNNLVFSVGIRF